MARIGASPGKHPVLELVLLVGALVLFAPLARAEKAADDAARTSDDLPTHFGVGLVFGYEWGLALSHRVSAGVILGDASTSAGDSGDGYEPSYSFPGGGGRGLLLQAEIGARAVKLSAGFADAQMLYMPPLSWGWAIKASYLEPHEITETFRSRRYAGAELELAYGVKFSAGLFQGLDGDRGKLFTWGVGIGF